MQGLVRGPNRVELLRWNATGSVGSLWIDPISL